MATAQVLFHRLYCKKSLARFYVKVAASCVWLAAKLQESPRKFPAVLNVFHRLDRRREAAPPDLLDPFSKKSLLRTVANGAAPTSTLSSSSSGNRPLPSDAAAAAAKGVADKNRSSGIKEGGKTLNDFFPSCRSWSTTTRLSWRPSIWLLRAKSPAGQAVDSATQILKEGGMDTVKLEGAIGSRISAERGIDEAGVAVMGHVGLTHETMIDSPKPQIGQESYICGRDDGILNTRENVQINNSGSEDLLGQEVHDESNIVNHVVGSNRGVAAILAKPLQSKRRNRKSKLTGRALKSCSSSTGKLKPPGRKGLGGAALKPRHDARTVNALNRQINTLMESGYREEAIAVYELILLAGCKPDSYTYLHLIKGFCEGGELAEARELFKRVLAEDNFCGRSEVILYNAMVHGLGSAGLVKEAFELVEEMIGRGFAPDMYTYNSILHSLGKVGKVTEALTIFESMADNGCSPDVVTYNSVIRCLGKAGKANEAYKVYEGMRTEGYLPDLVTFNTLIPILCKTGELDLAINLYEFMVTSGCEPDVYTYTSLVTGFCWANRIDEALLVSVEMTKNGCAPNTVTFNSWLDGLCKGGRVLEASLLFDKMLVLGYIPDKITYSILIDAFCKTGQFVDKSFELLKDLLKCSACILDTRTNEIVYQSFQKVGMLKQAKRIARNARAKQPRRVCYNLKLPVATLKMVT